MKTFTLEIKSKNESSKNNCLLVLKKNILNNWNNFERHFSKKVKRKKITLLKSPHVNKKAQEQFEFRIFKEIFTIRSLKNFKCLTLLKKFNSNAFSDIHLKLTYRIKKNNLKTKFLDIFFFDRLKLKKCCSFNIGNTNIMIFRKKNTSFKNLIFKNVIFFLNLLESYGEIFKIFV